MRSLFIALVLVIGLSSIANGQHDDSRTTLIKNISTYRTELLERVGPEYKIFIKGYQDLNSDSLPRRWTSTIVYMFNELIYRLGPFAEQAYEEEFSQDKYFKTLLDSIEFIEVQLLVENKELVDLMAEGILSDSFPHPIAVESVIFEEIGYYNFNKNECIAEIGVGLGGFSLLVAFQERFKNLYITELDKQNVDFLDYRFNNLPDHIPQENIFAIKGKKRNTKLPKDAFNKIIIRNTFHHFDQAEKMVKSIHKNLFDNGFLYVMEYKWEDEEHVCPRVLSQSEIINSIPSEYFIYDHIFDMKDRYIIRYRKNPK